MLCPKCGQELPEGTGICPNCGTDAEDINTQGLPDDIAVEPRIGAETKDKKAAFGRREGTLKPLFREISDEVRPESSEPALDENGEDETGDQSDTEQSGLKTVVAIISAVIFIAGGVLVHSSLPESRFSRYMKKARAAYEVGSYSEASGLYHKALAIHPDSEEAQMNLDDMYRIVTERVVAAYDEGRFEESVKEARILFEIRPDAQEDNIKMMEDAYVSWASFLGGQGSEADVDALMRAASDELPPESVERIRQEADSAHFLNELNDQLASIADRAVEADAGLDQVTVFRALEEAYLLLTVFRENGGRLPLRFLDESGSHGVEFNIDSRGNAQVYIGEFASGRIKNGSARTYFVAEAGTDNSSYEFFETEWVENDPRGEFKEIDYANGPENGPTGILTGSLYDGHYNGAIRHTRGDITYNMRFSYGSVEVLDTTDPNGDRNNVVGYTDSRDNWLVFSDSALSSKYGVRYLR